MAGLLRLTPWSSFAHIDLLTSISDGYDLDQLYTDYTEEGSDEPTTSTLAKQRIVIADEGYYWCLGGTPHETDSVKVHSPRVPITVLTDDEGNKWTMEIDYYRQIQ